MHIEINTYQKRCLDRLNDKSPQTYCNLITYFSDTDVKLFAKDILFPLIQEGLIEPVEDIDIANIYYDTDLWKRNNYSFRITVRGKFCLENI